MQETIHFASLGCAKNFVDSERMLGLAHAQGLTAVADPAEAAVIVVNTCGFIAAAKEESINTILEMARHKQEGHCQTLVVAGCLSQRYPRELSRELPEVDYFLGTADLPRLKQIFEDRQQARRLMVGRPEGLVERDYQRKLIGPQHTAFLKISEGCNRPCAFCIIPLMRGRQRSRSVDSLVDEATGLANQGVRELVLVAQDTTAYGRDLGRDVDLVALLNALNHVDGIRWIRIHYAYPSMVSDSLAQTMAELSKVVPYMDMPIQHVDDTLLRRMRRGYAQAHIRSAIDRLRSAMPDVVIRTTLICGHPGETEDAHLQLLHFIDEALIDRLGVFTYSAEEGTHAAVQPDPVDEHLAAQRRNQVMLRQRGVSRAKLLRLRGQVVEVMVDGPSPESEYLLCGRLMGQSPEVDGSVTLTDGTANPGEVIRARVTDTSDYDLVGTLQL